jgi:hypothetical protein
MNETIKILEEDNNFLDEWISNFKSANEIYPEILKMKQRKEWQLKTLKNAPEGSEQFFSDVVNASISQDYYYRQRVLHKLPDFDKEQIKLSQINTSCCGATIGCCLQNATISNDPNIKTWSIESFNNYKRIQDNDYMKEQICKSLCKLNPQLEKRFRETEIVYERCIEGTSPTSSTAAEMRTVLEKFKGEIEDRGIQKNVKKNQEWTTIAKNLSVDPENITIYNQVVNTGLNIKGLCYQLSEVFKNGKPYDIANLHSTYIDILYTSPSILKIDKDKSGE